MRGTDDLSTPVVARRRASFFPAKVPSIQRRPRQTGKSLMAHDRNFFHFRPGAGELTVAGRTFRLPSSRKLRIIVGFLFIFGGIFGFLPILGFWMIPLGLLILSQDIPAVRRWRRALAVRLERRKRPKGKGLH